MLPFELPGPRQAVEVPARLLQRALRSLRPATQGYDVSGVPHVGDPEFARLVEALTDAPVTHGNLVQVLRNGDQIFPAMLGAIRAAEQTVDFATYVYWTGSIADEMVEALCERASNGVEVNVLLDAAAGADLLVVGSRGHGGFAGMLLGSVSGHVVAHAPCAVVVVKAAPTAENTRHFSGTRP